MYLRCTLVMYRSLDEVSGVAEFAHLEAQACGLVAYALRWDDILQNLFRKFDT